MTDQLNTADELLRICNWILADAKTSLDYADQVLVSREAVGALREALRSEPAYVPPNGSRFPDVRFAPDYPGLILDANQKLLNLQQELNHAFETRDWDAMRLALSGMPEACREYLQALWSERSWWS